MNTRRPLVAVALSAALLLSGCTVAKPPPGIDGDLANGWPALPTPAYGTPQAGRCYDSELVLAATDSDYEETPCTVDHDVEVAAVETVGGAGAAALDPPADPSPDFAAIEYAGAIAAASDVYPDDGSGQHQLYGSRCESTIAAFLGMSVAQYRRRPELYTMWWWQGAKTWALGDHGVRCFVVLTSMKRITGTLRGHGPTRVG